MLLFRHGKDKGRKIDEPGLCVVFLVGETPLSGIHKQAFSAALQMMADAGVSTDVPVRVIGPYFSGSQTSLQFVLGDWWGTDNLITPNPRPHPPYRFRIITGNATAVRKKEFFSFEANKDNFPAWKPDAVEFSSTVIPTRTTLAAMLHFLRCRDESGTRDALPADIGHVPGKVALLTEGNTGFGKAFANLDSDQILNLRFPLHISRVKNEYNQAAKEKDKQKGLTEEDPLLGMSIAEDQGQVEGVPSQGGATTTAMSGQVLSRILTTISREQCRYVGVIASDTRDKLFLIRLIREHCPDVCVFVTDGDLLLTHPDYQYYMRGVIIGSTYPLVPRNQIWVHSGTTERILFPSVGSQGYYNATLMHMGVRDQLLEYSAGVRPARLRREAGFRTPAHLDQHGRPQRDDRAAANLHALQRPPRVSGEERIGRGLGARPVLRGLRLPRRDAAHRPRLLGLLGLPDRAPGSIHTPGSSGKAVRCYLCPTSSTGTSCSVRK